jgi:hypothetical protein
MSPSKNEEGPPEDRLTRARRRRAERRLKEMRSDERDAILRELGEQVSINTTLLLQTVLSGLLIGLGYRFDQLVLILAGMLVAPRMASIIGLAAAAVLGSMRTFLRMLIPLIIFMAIFVLAAGLSGGMGMTSESISQMTLVHSELNYLDFGLVLVGSAILAVSFVRSREMAPLASTAVAYEVLLPLGAVAASIFGKDQAFQWGALLTFCFHLTWAVATVVSVLIALGFRPQPRKAGTLIGFVILMSVVVLMGMLSMGGAILVLTPVSTATMTPTPSITPPPTSTYTATSAPTVTSSPTSTPTTTSQATSTPTPSQGFIFGTGGVGVMLRESPNGPSLGGLFDGAQVEVIGGPLLIEGAYWWEVRTSTGDEGWVLGDFLATATPEP